MIKKLIELQPIDGLSRRDKDTLLARNRIERCAQGYRFVSAGVFSTDQTTYIVIPWVAEAFRKTNIKSTDPCSLMLTAFDWLKNIPTTGYISTSEIQSGREFLLHSLLQYLIPLIENGLKYNIFRAEHQSLNAIKGRWDIGRDIRSGPFPTLFSCDVETCDRNHSILSIARQFCADLAKTAESSLLKHKALQIESLLGQISDYPSDTLKSLSDAETLAGTDRRFEAWSPWLQMLRQTITNHHSLVDLAAGGLTQDFVFNTASFFEQAIEQILLKMKFAVSAQKSGHLLGGSSWLWEDRDIEAEDEVLQTAARNRSRPDLLVQVPGFDQSILIECKYKKLEVVELAKDLKLGKRIANFNRDDRNQLLSFVLSKSDELQFNSSFIVVIYPARGTVVESPVLCFSARTSAHGELESLTWGHMPASQANLRVHFFGLDVISALAEISRGVEGPEIARLRTFLLQGKYSAVVAA